MKTENLLLAGAAGVALLYLLRRRPSAPPVSLDMANARLTKYAPSFDWLNPAGYGGVGGSNRDYLETDASGVSIMP